jgi:hypothetical protein
MSTEKEPHYFSVDKVWNRGPEYHNALFGRGAEYAYFGECSTTYAASSIALRRIAESLSDPRFIFLVREPVERMISHYRWMCALGLEKRKLLEAVIEDGYGFDPNRSVRGNYMAYLQFSSYSHYLPLWQDAFGHRNVLVLFSDELSTSPLDVVNRSFRFLGLEPLDYIQALTENRTTDVPVHNLLGKFVSPLIPSSAKRRVAKRSKIRSAWNRIAAAKIAPVTVTVDEHEREQVSSMLSREIDYFNGLRQEFTSRSQEQPPC